MLILLRLWRSLAFLVAQVSLKILHLLMASELPTSCHLMQVSALQSALDWEKSQAAVALLRVCKSCVFTLLYQQCKLALHHISVVQGVSGACPHLGMIQYFSQPQMDYIVSLPVQAEELAKVVEAKRDQLGGSLPKVGLHQLVNIGARSIVHTILS